MIGAAVEGMPWLGTFHAIGARILRRHAELVGLRSDFTILDADDQLRLMKQVIQAEGLDDKRWPQRRRRLLYTRHPATPPARPTDMTLKILIMLLLIVGSVMEPLRLYQIVTGSLGRRRGITGPAVIKASRLFYWAFPFWLALVWGFVNIELLQRCSGDTCIGYMLPAIPFPFIYGLAEFRLLMGWQGSEG